MINYLVELPKLLIDAPSATLRFESSKSEVSESDNRDVVEGGDK